MFVKVTRAGAHRYIQLAESFRDEAGRPRNRVIASLGRADRIGSDLDALINGLMRASGRAPIDVDEVAPLLQFDSARSLGDVWALTALWKQLGLDTLAHVFRRSRHGFDVEAMIRTMVFNRLCEPESKLGVLRWLETVSLPGVDASEVTHQRLLRAMDAWVERISQVEEVLAGLIRPLIDTELAVVFYDVTTISVSGETELKDDVRAFGRSKRDTIERQFALGLVQTAEGIPLAHEVFEGNVAETKTLLPVIERLAKRFKIRRVVLVADRGMLSAGNVERLRQVRLPSAEALEFILAVPAARYIEYAKTIATMPAQAASLGEPAGDQRAADWIAETPWDEGRLRLVVAHDAAGAARATAERRARLADIDARGAQMAEKLDAQDAGAKKRGRRLTDKGATLSLHDAIAQARLGNVIDLERSLPLFSYAVREDVLGRFETLDGKLVLLTNVNDLPAAQIVARYKSLADIERGFRVLKSEIEIGPVYHRLPDRIRAHAGICFVALLMHRVMRLRLKAAGAECSPDRALATLRQIQHHAVTVNGVKSLRGVSMIDSARRALLKALKLPPPTLHDPQMKLL